MTRTSGASPLRVLVTGPRGRMGRLIVQRIQEAADLELAGTIDREQDLEAGLEATRAQVMVDVAGPETAFEFARKCLRLGVRPVVGSSGLSADAVAALRDLAAREGGGGLWVPNFSVASVLLQGFAEQAARWFGDVEIVEAHHSAKLDSPSGTALHTAERIARQRPAGKEAREGPGRGLHHAGIPVHALRLPGVVADQEVRFGGEGEWLSLRHVTTDRASFMPGVLLAVRSVGALEGFHVGLDVVLQGPD